MYSCVIIIYGNNQFTMDKKFYFLLNIPFYSKMSHYGIKIDWEWQVSLVSLLMGMSLVFLEFKDFRGSVSQDALLYNFSPYTLIFSPFPVFRNYWNLSWSHSFIRLYSKHRAHVYLNLLLNMNAGKGDCPGYWILARCGAGWGNYTCAWSCCKYFSECQRIERWQLRKGWSLADLNTLLY